MTRTLGTSFRLAKDRAQDHLFVGTFTPTPTLAIDGADVRVRADDGLHLTDEGSRVMADVTPATIADAVPEA